MIITTTIPLLTMTLIALVHSGVEDFDRENAEDPQQHSEYAMETFQYYKNREETFRVPDYLQVDFYWPSKYLMLSSESFRDDRN